MEGEADMFVPFYSVGAFSLVRPSLLREREEQVLKGFLSSLMPRASFTLRVSSSASSRDLLVRRVLSVPRTTRRLPSGRVRAVAFASSTTVRHAYLQSHWKIRSRIFGRVSSRDHEFTRRRGIISGSNDAFI